MRTLNCDNGSLHHLADARLIPAIERAGVLIVGNFIRAPAADSISDNDR
jgi:hypothetical protein